MRGFWQEVEDYCFGFKNLASFKIMLIGVFRYYTVNHECLTTQKKGLINVKEKLWFGLKSSYNLSYIDLLNLCLHSYQTEWLRFIFLLIE